MSHRSMLSDHLERRWKILFFVKGGEQSVFHGVSSTEILLVLYFTCLFLWFKKSSIQNAPHLELCASMPYVKNMGKSSCRICAATLVLYLPPHPHWNNRLGVCYPQHRFFLLWMSIFQMYQVNALQTDQGFLFYFIFLGFDSHFEDLFLGS